MKSGLGRVGMVDKGELIYDKSVLFRGKSYFLRLRKIYRGRPSPSLSTPAK